MGVSASYEFPVDTQIDGARTERGIDKGGRGSIYRRGAATFYPQAFQKVVRYIDHSIMKVLYNPSICSPTIRIPQVNAETPNIQG